MPQEPIHRVADPPIPPVLGEGGWQRNFPRGTESGGDGEEHAEGQLAGGPNPFFTAGRRRAHGTEQCSPRFERPLHDETVSGRVPKKEKSPCVIG